MILKNKFWTQIITIGERGNIIKLIPEKDKKFTFYFLKKKLYFV